MAFLGPSLRESRGAFSATPITPAADTVCRRYNLQRCSSFEHRISSSTDRYVDTVWTRISCGLQERRAIPHDSRRRSCRTPSMTMSSKSCTRGASSMCCPYKRRGGRRHLGGCLPRRRSKRCRPIGGVASECGEIHIRFSPLATKWRSRDLPLGRFNRGIR